MMLIGITKFRKFEIAGRFPKYLMTFSFELCIHRDDVEVSAVIFPAD